MEVDVPLDAVTSLKEQQEWDSDSIRRSSKEHIHKRPRNLQKKARKAHHEQYIETPRSAVGEYIGDGQGESSTVESQLTSADVDIDDAEPGLDDQSQNHEEVSSDNANRLLIFYDCETTGFSIYDNHITEVAAKVVLSPVSLETPTFSSLVATSRRIPASVTGVTGITNIMLRGERPLSAVFPSFIDWLATTTAHVNEVTGEVHYPVLVAHNGFKFDFPILLAEVERRPESLATSIFEAKNIHFSDTLPLLRQMKKNGDSHLAGKKLKMKDLYLHTLGTPMEGAHRAFTDVLAMEAVMTHHSLISCLTNLPIRSAKKQMELWTSQKRRFHRSRALTRSLGITAAQAKRLFQLGLEHSALVTLRSNSGTPEAFMEALKGKGVKSKALCIKLSKHVHSSPSKPHTPKKLC